MALKGINLGGWLVLEKWMTPSLFKGTDARNEFELSKTEDGRRRIKKHHESFITVNDLTWLQKHGFEIVRVPVGYWTLGDDERYVKATERLDWLLKTCDSLGLKVLLDLHAAPGAQNRAEHSGSGNTIADSKKWLKNRNEQERTIRALEKIAERYSNNSSLWGIELINEPSIDKTGLRLAWFYRRAYKRLIMVLRPGIFTIFSDGYAPLRLTNCFWLMATHRHPVAMDCHIYQTFGRRDKKRPYEKALRRLANIQRFLRFLQLQQPIIVGEWSATLPYSTTFDQTFTYLSTQQNAFSSTTAHFYWNYKTEDGGRWSYRDIAQNKLLQ